MKPGIRWYFPVLTGGGEEGNTSNDVEAFKGEDLYVNLAREICQNSCDALERGKAGPVVVKFQLREMPVGDYELFRGLKEAADGCERYWGQRNDGVPVRLRAMLDEAKATLSKDTVPVLVIGDYNTPGLKGAYDLYSPSGSFGALVYGEGVTYKESDTAAGSFGIGRNAPFACSTLSCVCYNTLAKDGGKAFAGVAKLATLLNSEGKKTRRQGRYQYNDDDQEIWRPIGPDDHDRFADEFKRTEYGTDVLILGFRSVENWNDQLVDAVLKNFYVAINEKSLIVEVQGTRIDSFTIEGLFEERLKRHAEQNDRQLLHAWEHYKTLTSKLSIRIPLSILGDSDAELIVRVDESVGKLKSVAFFRSSGMLIRTYKPQGIFHPYSAVFIAKSKDLEIILRDTEPARHNDWDWTRAKDPVKAKKAVNGLKRKIKESLKSICETLVEETMDAVGAADYLPDSIDRASQGGGDDILRPLIKIGKAKKVNTREERETISGKNGDGEKVAGDGGNRRRHPDPIDPPEPPDVVKPVEGGAISGIKPGRGEKLIRRKMCGTIRAFPLTASAGIYRIKILPKESTDNAYVECSVFGENGRSDHLPVVKAMLDGSTLSVNAAGNVGPFSVISGEPKELIVTFEEKERLALGVELRMEDGE